jgi:hypothetical protein
MERLEKRLAKKGLKLSCNMSSFGDNKYFVDGRSFKTLKEINAYYF